MKNQNIIAKVLLIVIGSVLAFFGSSLMAMDQLTVIQAGMTAEKFKIVQEAITAGLVRCGNDTNQPQLNQLYIQDLQRRNVIHSSQSLEKLNIIQDAVKANLVQCKPEASQPQLNHSYIQELQRKGVIRNVVSESSTRCI